MSGGVDERRLLAGLRASAAQLPRQVLIGPGDDMALVEFPGQRALLAVDQVVEGVHFVPGTPLELVARKVIARNLSDVAAMAGIPVATLAAATLPAEMSQEEARNLLESVQRHATALGCPLVGGDTCVHKKAGAPLTIGVTIVAAVRADGRVISRGGARPGDQLVVSGPLGGSLGSDGMGRHLSFTPRLAEAHALVDALGSSVHAMIDISDGLGRECAALVESSSRSSGEPLAAIIERIGACTHDGCTPLQALRDGEDHELLAAVAADAAVPAPWIPIGRVERRAADAPAAVVAMIDGRAHRADELGWNHG